MARDPIYYDSSTLRKCTLCYGKHSGQEVGIFGCAVNGCTGIWIIACSSLWDTWASTSMIAIASTWSSEALSITLDIDIVLSLTAMPYLAVWVVGSTEPSVKYVLLRGGVPFGAHGWKLCPWQWFNIGGDSPFFKLVITLWTGSILTLSLYEIARSYFQRSHNLAPDAWDMFPRMILATSFLIASNHWYASDQGNRNIVLIEINSMYIEWFYYFMSCSYVSRLLLSWRTVLP